ncbi:hypothetical protein OV208_07165 [Corallococcus sp. bb12-1]|uniref:hypothetical protein n=1 Tax=Corallococcus sp. bb12-1 TaxID=2996784 RepID=UPI00226F3B8D|nr:hypothetical protein [Corallococcus sp. bb12-1]MCY1041094.1 hypothetical protein [Corallococcus sp. bb12-1]
MAKAMGGDVVMQMLREFREMQEEAKVQYARTDAVIDAVIRQTEMLLAHSRLHFERTRVLFARSRELSAQTRVLFEQTRVLFEQTRVLFEQTRVLSEQTRTLFERTDEMSGHVGVLFESTDTFRESLEGLSTHLLALARELGGVKSTHGRMLERVSRSIHRLAEEQDSDRQRIEILELHLDGAGKS